MRSKSAHHSFKVLVFATGLESPRTMRVAPNGDIFVSESRTGKVRVMRPSADGARAVSVETFAQGLSLPSGLAFYPAGDHPQWLYVAEPIAWSATRTQWARKRPGAFRRS